MWISSLSMQIHFHFNSLVFPIAHLRFSWACYLLVQRWSVLCSPEIVLSFARDGQSRRGVSNCLLSRRQSYFSLNSALTPRVSEIVCSWAFFFFLLFSRRVTKRIQSAHTLHLASCVNILYNYRALITSKKLPLIQYY